MNIPRPKLLNELIVKKNNGMIKVVTGIRRSGKSYLLNQLFVEHLQMNGVSREHILCIDLEDFTNRQLRKPEAMLDYIIQHSTDDDRYYILIDEVQLLSDFEEVLNTLLKRRKYDVYVTGSNARFLSRDVITTFRGRGDEIRVYPFDFREFSTAKSSLSEQARLREFMLYGGLPQVCTFSLAKQKTDYLTSLFEQTYLIDIKERNGIRHDADLAELVDVLASSIGALTSPLKLQNTFKTVKQSNISYDTINHYLTCLQDAFLITKSLRYDIKGRKYIDTPQKYYFTDLGLRNARIGFRQNEETHLMENLVYNELLHRGWLVDVGNIEVHTKNATGANIRQMAEIDFVCNRGYERVYVQVAYMLPDEEKWQQELRPLNLVRDSFRKVLIVGDHTPTHQNQDGVFILNLMDFLLQEEI